MPKPSVRTGETIAGLPSHAKASLRWIAGHLRSWRDPFRAALATVRNAALDLVAPGECRHCRAEVDGSHPFCESCLREIRWIERACRVCGTPVAAIAGIAEPKGDPRATLWVCGDCRQLRPAHSRVVVAARYQGPFRTAVVRFKYAGDVACRRFLVESLAFAARRALGAWLETDHAEHRRGAARIARIARSARLARLGRRPTPFPELCVTAVPSHLLKRLWRGRDLAGELGRAVALELDLPFRRLLRKTRFTRAQVTLSSAARRENLRGAFRISPWWRDLRGMRVLLIDDVLTTGTTTARCVRVLRRHGASEVVILAGGRS